MLRWYLVLTKPAGERVAQENLERQGYRVYYPRLRQQKLQRGRLARCVSALFPRYLFLQLDVGRQSLAPVRSTLGVVDAVRFGMEYAVVPGHVVEGLIRRADPVSGLHELQRRCFRPGDLVRVIAGAFAGFEGVFECASGADRVVLLFNLLGHEASVRVPANCVAPGCA